MHHIVLLYRSGADVSQVQVGRPAPVAPSGRDPGPPAPASEDGVRAVTTALVYREQTSLALRAEGRRSLDIDYHCLQLRETLLDASKALIVTRYIH